MEVIQSKQNQQIKKWASLHQKKYRDAYGLFLIEGEHLIQEALKEELVETILVVEDDPFHFPKTVQVTQEIMDKLSQSVSGCKYMGVCYVREKAIDYTQASRMILCDCIQDPGNLGTMIRSAISFGFDGMILSQDTVSEYNEKTIRSTQGALFHLPIKRDDLKAQIKQLKENGFVVVGTDLQASHYLKKYPAQEKMAFVFGNEGQGVSKEILDLCDVKLKIEMNGFESLNVSVATGIILYTYQK